MKKLRIITIIMMLATLLFVFSGCSSDSENSSDSSDSSESNTQDNAIETEDVKESSDDEKTSTTQSEGDKEFTLEELQTYNGEDGNSAYVAVDGVVYDVTDVPNWDGGKHNGNTAGKDLTVEIGKAPHGKSKLEGLTVVGKVVE